MESTGRFTDELNVLVSQPQSTCLNCGNELIYGNPAYAGYDEKGSSLYVGECCKNVIKELAARILWWVKEDFQCHPETRLWRYMDFAKFVAILDQKALYFARADKLGDRYEGASGILERKEKWDNHYLNFFRHAVANPPEGYPVPSDDVVEKDAARLLRDWSEIALLDRQSTFVSCWHANTVESEALWMLYCPPSTTGIAIETNARLLMDALGYDNEIKLGKVQYVDFRIAYADTNNRLFYKRKSLSHEAEVRAIIQHLRYQKSERQGISISTDLDKLLLSVIPSPFAPSWFAALVESVMSTFNVNAPIKRSELLSDPFF